jgi:co-chaperonin GroES (HSP10)
MNSISKSKYIFQNGNKRIITTLNRRIIVHKFEEEAHHTPSGIILSHSKEKTTVGIVVATFKSFKDEHSVDISSSLNIGDSVVISEYMDTSFEHNGKRCLIFRRLMY